MSQEDLFQTLDSARFDDSGKFRYELWRDLGDRQTNQLCCFVMLNPSTADAKINDPTVRRCIGYARGWGFGRLCVLNLYALRSTDPAALRPDPVAAAGDPENLATIMRIAAKSDLVVLAWGVNPQKLAAEGERRDKTVVEALKKAGVSLHCLDTTKGGFPRHPLYCRSELTPRPF